MSSRPEAASADEECHDLPRLIGVDRADAGRPLAAQLLDQPRLHAEPLELGRQAVGVPIAIGAAPGDVDPIAALGRPDGKAVGVGKPDRGGWNGQREWSQPDSNLRPSGCKPDALAN
jgi:hypothetical protein